MQVFIHLHLVLLLHGMRMCSAHVFVEIISGTCVKWRSKKKIAERTAATRVCVDTCVGQLQALPDALEVVAAPGFSLEQQDHRRLEFSLRF